MIQPIKRTDSIKKFLMARSHLDLAMMYSANMECQVNVAQDGGDKIKGEFRGRTWQGWTDGITTWKALRIPHNANTEPVYVDRDMSFDLAAHAEAIGMTGWDWVNKRSLWVAFDFDAIVGHSEKHKKGLSVEQLEEIKDKVSEIPWITIRKSTSGNGLHLYVYLHDDPSDLTQGVPTSTHTEHAAVGRSILSKIAGLTGLSLDTKVDICGQNMWVWHRKMVGSPGGLSLIQQGESLLTVPNNWRDHISVIKGARQRSLPRFIADLGTASDADNLFLELTGQVTRIPLDKDHTRLVQYLEDKKTASWWDPDHHMLVTHTVHLKNAHKELEFRGIFETISSGTDTDTNNCYLFPLRRGAWTVRRYSLGVQEAPTWDQDGRGWTRCYFNCLPDLASASKGNNGIESPSRGFVFREAQKAVETAKLLGALIPEIPQSMLDNPATLKNHKDGRLLMEIEGDRDGVADMTGWLHEKGKWKRLFNLQAKPTIENDSLMYDDIVRHLITEADEDSGWALKSEGTWRNEPITHIKVALKSMDVATKEIDTLLGAAVMKCWRLVNRPFQPEFPGNREWNREAAQFSVIPSLETDNLSYPTWQKVLQHCGQGLDTALEHSSWAKANGITTGSDYLKIWCASLFKETMEPLPYLFFYSPEQNTGKSSFHEALSLLLTKGYQRADQALVSQSNFNGELRSAILCVVEELDLRRSKDASNRIKDWVTARLLPIHEKGETPYHVPNSTHWIQTANEAAFCPTFPGDTRITMIRVQPLPLEDMIPKRELMEQLKNEAPDFLAALKMVEIPRSNDRLNVPVITTSEKLEVEKMNRTTIQEFVDEKIFKVTGIMVPYAEAFDSFLKWVDPSDSQNWTKRKFVSEFPLEFPRGRRPTDSAYCFGNCSLIPHEGPKLPELVSVETEKGNSFLRSRGIKIEPFNPNA